MPYITALPATSIQTSSGHGREIEINEGENDVEVKEVTKNTRKRLIDVEKDRAMSKWAKVAAKSGMRHPQEITTYDELPNKRMSEPIALAVCGTVLAVLASIFHTVGYSTQHWMESFKQANTRFDR